MTEINVAVNAVITFSGTILLGKKVKKDGRPFSDKWHFPGGHLKQNEEPRQALKRQIEEETGLEVEIHQLIEATAYSWYEETDDNIVRITYHCNAKSKNAEPKDDLEEVKWVKPGNLKEEICDIEKRHLERSEDLSMLIQKIVKAPY